VSVQLPTDDQRLKEATKALQKAAGGVESCAEITGLGKSQHGNYQNINSPDFIPVSRVRELEAVTHGYPGHPQVTRELCKQAGGVFVSLPQFSGAAHDALPGQVMALAKELGEVSAKISEGLAGDNALDAREIGAVLAELDDHDAASAALRHTLVHLRNELLKASPGQGGA
jgi:hypothetical protein